MNQTIARQKVDNYLKYNLTEPLSFYTSDYDFKKGCYVNSKIEFDDLKISSTNKLQKVLKNAIEYANEYASGIDGVIETYCNSLRSALDIWRHLKKYNPKLSIYEVMKCIHDYSDILELYSHFCCTIERRVFIISDGDEFQSEINDESERDEFGLTFSEWSLL